MIKIMRSKKFYIFIISCAIRIITAINKYITPANGRSTFNATMKNYM